MHELRPATAADLPALRRLMARAIDALQSSYLSADQVAASRLVMGLDTQLIADGTYFVVETGDRIAGCGGWSRRATLYGGDHSAGLREPRLLDPASEAARVRAMYTDPDHVRRGIGRAILSACEAAAAVEGFRRAELMATLAGEPLYSAAGYAEIERIVDESGPVGVPLIRMGKALA
ncbi:GNAT family N-acetyltransferase [Sphingomonas donggukensis]|uniref:GNAT family N-acetyltransferase n=1 Tax=Sphingomonas donggukensis TaxID=2949093 RepID=A0ABY4TUZ5_9SPHN|nr:GNAT family N-acetyltransferase [Sphingomonas donggukensis]URW76173.1 GNAT family N-acetyltransferase [Sphingomonas donggukensis]